MNRVLFSNCCVHEGKIYFIDYLSGLPAFMDLSTGEIRIVENLIGYEWCFGDTIDSMLYHNGKIYALLLRGDKMMIWNLAKRSCSYIDIDCQNLAWGNYAYFMQYSEKIYIFPNHKREVIVVSCVDQLVTKLHYHSENTMTCGQIVNDSIWLFPKNGREVVQFQLKTNQFKVYKTSIQLKDCLTCTTNGEIVYILSVLGEVYAWDVEQKRMICIYQLSEDNDIMYPLIYVNNKLFSFPTNGSDVKILHLKEKKVELYRDYPSDFEYYAIKNWHYLGYCEDVDNIYMACREANYLLRIEKDAGIMSWIKLQGVDTHIRKRALWNYSSGILNERVLELNSFIEDVCEYREDVVWDTNRTGGIIWTSLNERIESNG